MAKSLKAPHRVRVPPGSRDWLLPLADPGAQPLRRAGIAIVGISAVGRGFDWPGPGATHLLLGTIEGSGVLEADGKRLDLGETDLVISPAGVARRFTTRSAHWKFLAIRLIDDPRWEHLHAPGVQRLPGHWLRRLVPPVEGMLAEHPLGEAVPSHTPRSHGAGESPAEYLSSRYADRFGDAALHSDAGPRADVFELHATILRHQVERMLTPHAAAAPDQEAVRLASLWSRVSDRPRGPWDAADLAGSLGTSRTSLFRIVRRHHGTTPARVVEQLRMAQAQRLLAESRHPIEVIADQIGYASAFSFSTAFKRAVGMSPSRFRSTPSGRGSVAPTRQARPPPAANRLVRKMPCSS